jgi:hypothetical protein
VATQIPLVGATGFTLANFLQASAEVAVPLERVHREVEMRVDNQHDGSSSPK